MAGISRKGELDKPATRLDQVRFEEQLKERGIVDKNADGFITEDEIDTDRLPGKLEEIKRAAGPDGLLQPSEVAGIKVRGGFTKQKAANQSVIKLTQELQEASQKLKMLRGFNTPETFLEAVKELNDIGAVIKEVDLRSSIGLADRALLNRLEDALKELYPLGSALNGFRRRPSSLPPKCSKK